MTLTRKVRLSIIIPVYNAEKFVHKSIDSILKIIPLDGTVQLIIINDGSNDNSSQVIDTYKNYSFIVIRHTVNQGVGATRNLGITLAEGTYIGFVDGDDYWSDSFEWSLLSSAMNADIDLIETAYNVVLENESMISTYRHPRDEFPNHENIDSKLLSSIAREGTWYLWSRFYKRTLWNDLFFESGRIYEDILLAPQVISRAKTVTAFHLPLVNYRFNPESITRAPNIKNVFDLLFVSRELGQLSLDPSDIFAITARSCYSQALRVYAKFAEINFPQNVIEEVKLTKSVLYPLCWSFDLRFIRYYLFPIWHIQNMHRVTRRKLGGRGRRSKRGT